MDPTDENPPANKSEEASVEPKTEDVIAAGEVPVAPLSPPQLPADLGAAPISGPYGYAPEANDSAAVSPSNAFTTSEEGQEPLSFVPPSAPQPPDSMAGIPDSARPSYRFFGIVAALSLLADIATKVWAEVVINQRGWEPIKIIGDSVSITLAYNKGGAWGMGSQLGDGLRKPFFFLVSAFAIFFIISLYGRLHPTQKALKWGLPMVLGGALGNLNDRITRSQVIDFIDYRGDWVMSTNAFIHKYYKGWAVTDHWPTFNVADIAICIGVGLMAVDMFTHRPRRHTSLPPQDPAVGGGGPSEGGPSPETMGGPGAIAP